MTRKEEIQEAAEHYERVDATNLACDYGWGERAIQQQCFKAGVKWADQHPREGLWESEKVIDYIYHHAHVRTFGDIVIDDMSVTEFIETMKKAMEE